jgi:hypothetical protein
MLHSGGVVLGTPAVLLEVQGAQREGGEEDGREEQAFHARIIDASDFSYATARKRAPRNRVQRRYPEEAMTTPATFKRLAVASPPRSATAAAGRSHHLEAADFGGEALTVRAP